MTTHQPAADGLPRFALGQIVGTPGALRLLASHAITPASLLERHVHGDWGDVCAADRRSNEAALTSGARIWSIFKIGDDPLWVITEADPRESTCLLLPGEY